MLATEKYYLPTIILQLMPLSAGESWDEPIHSGRVRLCYKMGQLQILDLRFQVRKELGSQFDIRQFHDHIIDSGALFLLEA